MTLKYTIYLKDKCILDDLEEGTFRSSWEILNNLVGVMKTEYTVEDLSYTAEGHRPPSED